MKLSSRRLKVDVGKYYFKDDSDETIELKVMQDDFDNKGIYTIIVLYEQHQYIVFIVTLYLLLHV